MDISLNREDYKLLKIVTDNSVEECVEAELALPEYMPEILRIIKSVAEPKINSCRLVGERVTVDGVCELRMIYTAEDGCIYCFSQSRPFTRHCENSAFVDALDVTSQVSVSYVNCRATSTKRAEIKAGIVIKVSAFSGENEEIISIGNTKDIQVKSTPLRAMSLGCRKTRSFSLSDNVSLPVPAAFIVSTCASAVCTDIRKINNKVMVKGDAVVDICYVNSADKSLTEHIKHTIPVNQILEFDGMEERFTGNVTLCVTAVDVVQKNESDGMGNAFDILLGIDASVTMWEEKELFIISDAYAVGASVELKKQPMVFYTALDEIRETYIFKDNFAVSGEGVSSILNVTGEAVSAQVKLENGNICVSGSLALSLLIKDTSGSFSGISKMLDFKYERKAGFEEQPISCVPEITVTAVDCAEKGNNSIDVRAEMRIVGSVFGKVTVDAVTDITESETIFVRNNNAITVYFPDCEESLWAIARRYNTTVDAIAAENDLEGDTTADLKMIFIPAV